MARLGHFMPWSISQVPINLLPDRRKEASIIKAHISRAHLKRTDPPTHTIAPSSATASPFLPLMDCNLITFKYSK